jgi:hypothetical protein
VTQGNISSERGMKRKRKRKRKRKARRDKREEGEEKVLLDNKYRSKIETKQE